MNRESLSPPQTHSTLVCPSSADVVPIGTNAPNMILDYLFWFAVILAIVFGLAYLSSKGKPANLAEKEEAAPDTDFEPPLPIDCIV